MYPIGQVWAEPGVRAEPLFCAFITFLNNITSDHAATVAGGCLPGECDCCADLVAEVQVEGWAWPLCTYNMKCALMMYFSGHFHSFMQLIRR